jgi:aminoglycoside 6'-N-acetyltransferase
VIEFQPLRKDHLPLLRDWLAREHVRRWWRDPIESLAEYEQAIDGLDPTDHYLILLDGRPVGMIETYLVSDSRSGTQSCRSAKASPASTS